MLSPTSLTKALFACLLFPPGNLPFFPVEFILFTPCFRSYPLLPCQGAALAHLDSLPHHDLMVWTDGSVYFLFGKVGYGVLANSSLFGADPVYSSFSAEACAILPALRWYRQHQQDRHFSSLFLLSDSRSVLATLLSPLYFLLPQTL